MKRRATEASVPVRLLRPGMPFPDPRDSGHRGLVAVTAELTPERLLEAYRKGIFPWFQDRGATFWFCPDPRMVLPPGDLRIGRSLRKTLRKGLFDVSLDTAFAEVIHGCAKAKRPAAEGTWITPAFIKAYSRLHGMGLAHSAEAWREGRLAGGLYGVSLGAVFFGESMFAREAEASKVALVRLVEQLRAWGFRMIDCQVHTEHLARLGATEWTRARFLRALGVALKAPTRRGKWVFDATRPAR